MHPSVLHSRIPMTQVQIVRNSEVENSQPIKDLRKCNDFSKVPCGLNIMRLFTFFIFDFLIVSMGVYLEDQGLMSSNMFVFPCGKSLPSLFICLLSYSSILF